MSKVATATKVPAPGDGDPGNSPTPGTLSVLVVDDEPDIQDALTYALTREGFQVEAASDGASAREKLEARRPSLILLDLRLPDVDGVDLCARLKQDPATTDIPIVMVTARAEEADVVSGLDQGADDYITKPFSPRQLVARVRAVLRRSEPRPEPPAEAGDRVVRGGLVLDLARYCVEIEGQDVALTGIQFRILLCLATSPGKVFTRNQLLQFALPQDRDVTVRNVDSHVKAIRQKLGSRRDLIETIRGVGYRFQVPSQD